jgi:very-short-patch-repair endonuclease
LFVYPPLKKGDEGGFSRMLKYNPQLKTRARTLRTHLTDAEQRLWSRLRGKQILGIQFYRQKPIGNYIVDFYAPTARLVIEVDGAHHLEVVQARYDRQRSESLEESGLKVLRFDDRQVLLELESVTQVIFCAVDESLR